MHIGEHLKLYVPRTQYIPALTRAAPKWPHPSLPPSLPCTHTHRPKAARGLCVLLDNDGTVTERGHRLSTARLQRLTKLLRTVGDAHALTKNTHERENHGFVIIVSAPLDNTHCDRTVHVTMVELTLPPPPFTALINTGNLQEQNGVRTQATMGTTAAGTSRTALNPLIRHNSTQRRCTM